LLILFRVLLGFDKEWKKQFNGDTIQKVEKLKKEQIEKNTLTSGIGKQEVSRLEIKRKQEKRDEARRRLLEGLKLIPPWLALLISIASLIISIFLGDNY